MDAGLADIFRRHRVDLLDQARRVVHVAVLAGAGRLDDEVVQGGWREAHGLAGAGGMFGMEETTRGARRVQDLLASPHPADQAWCDRLDDEARQLVASVQQESEDAQHRLDQRASGGGPGGPGKAAGPR